MGVSRETNQRLFRRHGGVDPFPVRGGPYVIMTKGCKHDPEGSDWAQTGGEIETYQDAKRLAERVKSRFGCRTRIERVDR